MQNTAALRRPHKNSATLSKLTIFTPRPEYQPLANSLAPFQTFLVLGARGDR